MINKTLLFLLGFEIFLHFGELFVLNAQTKGNGKEYVDQSYIKYQKSVTKVSFYERTSIIIFYIIIMMTFRKLRRKIKMEQAYFSALFMIRWFFTQVPVNFLKQFYLESWNSAVTYPVSKFITKEIVTVLFNLLFFNILIYLTRVAAFFTKSFKHPKEINVTIEQSDDTDNCSISCASDPFYSKSSINFSKIREQKRRLLNNYAKNRPLYICVFFILLFGYFLYPLFRLMINSIIHTYSQPNIPLQTALTTLKINTGIIIPRCYMLRTDNKLHTMSCKVEGVLRRKAIISENLASTFDTKDLDAILAGIYLVYYSKEGLFHFLLYIIEIAMFSYRIRKILTDHFPEFSSMSRRQLTIFLPIVFSSFLPIHTGFISIHRMLTKYYINKGDEYAVHIATPITDSLVKLYVHNRDIVTHFKPFSLFVRETPTITERLANIALFKVKKSTA